MISHIDFLYIQIRFPAIYGAFLMHMLHVIAGNDGCVFHNMTEMKAFDISFSFLAIWFLKMEKDYFIKYLHLFIILKDLYKQCINFKN